MARPIKNNAEYFSHDADMRNDLRIKAVRNRFGLEGYAMYCILLEFITDADNFALKYGDAECELISADMGINSTLLKKAVEYMVKINLLQFHKTNKGEVYIKCETLVKRFSGLLQKRKRQRSGVIDVDNSEKTELSTAITHKVKESKEKYIDKSTNTPPFNGLGVDARTWCEGVIYFSSKEDPGQKMAKKIYSHYKKAGFLYNGKPIDRRNYDEAIQSYLNTQNS